MLCPDIGRPNASSFEILRRKCTSLKPWTLKIVGRHSRSLSCRWQKLHPRTQKQPTTWVVTSLSLSSHRPTSNDPRLPSSTCELVPLVPYHQAPALPFRPYTSTSTHPCRRQLAAVPRRPVRLPQSPPILADRRGLTS